MIGCAQARVVVVMLVARADAMPAFGERRDVSRAAHDHVERAHGRGRQVRHLSAHRAQREPRVGQQSLRVVGIGDHDHRSLGDHAILGIEGAPRRALALDALDAAPHPAAHVLAAAREARDREAVG